MLIKNCLLIDGADIFEEKKDIRIEDGKIAEVSDCLEAAVGEEIVDAGGALVTPGIVEASCQLGVNSQVHRFEENDSEDVSPIAPELRAYDALNFEDEGFEMALRAGVTSVVAGPGNGNLIGGSCTAVKTAGGSRKERIIMPEAAYRFVLASGPRRKFGSKGKAPQTRLASAAMIRNILFKAREYARKEKAGEHQEFNLELSALARVFDGMPVQMVAMKYNDMETAVRIGEEFGLNYVLVEAYDAPIVIKDLARRDLRFVIGPLYGTAFSVEEKGRELDLGAILEKEGVHAAISTGHPQLNLEILQTQLILMTDRGLSRKEAIKGVTAYPAQYLGLSSVGTLEPGKDADLVIWDGDILQYDGGVKSVFINGKCVLS